MWLCLLLVELVVLVALLVELEDDDDVDPELVDVSILVELLVVVLVELLMEVTVELLLDMIVELLVVVLVELMVQVVVENGVVDTDVVVVVVVNVAVAVIVAVVVIVVVVVAVAVVVVVIVEVVLDEELAVDSLVDVADDGNALLDGDVAVEPLVDEAVAVATADVDTPCIRGVVVAACVRRVKAQAFRNLPVLLQNSHSASSTSMHVLLTNASSGQEDVHLLQTRSDVCVRAIDWNVPSLQRPASLSQTGNLEASHEPGSV